MKIFSLQSLDRRWKHMPSPCVRNSLFSLQLTSVDSFFVRSKQYFKNNLFYCAFLLSGLVVSIYQKTHIVPPVWESCSSCGSCSLAHSTNIKTKKKESILELHKCIRRRFGRIYMCMPMHRALVTTQMKHSNNGPTNDFHAKFFWFTRSHFKMHAVCFEKIREKTKTKKYLYDTLYE